MFRPIRERIKTPIDNEHEQIPMVNEKQTTNLRRTSSVYDNNPTTKTEGRRQRRIQQRSDTVAII
jgi:hypothetical protein